MNPDTDQNDFEAYRLLLDLWQQENPIKTNKLQVLLAVNALLVSALSLSQSSGREDWYVYVAGACFCLIWTFSIGRTSLYQAVWQQKLNELAATHGGDPRFHAHVAEAHRSRAAMPLRVLGGISSKWYLLFAPVAFAVAWMGALAYVLSH